MAARVVAEGREPPPLLVFVHIPKTAGTTLRLVLTANHPGRRTRRIGNVFKGGGGYKRGVTFEALGAAAKEGLPDVDVISGHVPLGVREHFARFMPEDRPILYFTFLRDPADRTLSHYFQIRESVERDLAMGRERSKQRSLGLPPLSAEPTIEELLAGGYIHDNLHTRMLCGDPEPFGEVTDEMLEQAKRNLTDGLAFFGLTERFDESLVLARRRLGLRSIVYRRPGSSASGGRVNPSRPRGDEIPADLREAAERCNRYDIELYEHAKQVFESAPEHGELDFRAEVAALATARDGGEVDLDATPPPPGFGGDDEVWTALVRGRVALLRTDDELARAEAAADEQRRREEEVMAELERIATGGKSRAGRDPETAQRLMHLIAPATNGGGTAPQETAEEPEPVPQRSRKRSKPRRVAAADGSKKRKSRRRRRKAARDG